MRLYNQRLISNLWQKSVHRKYRNLAFVDKVEMEDVAQYT